MLKKSLFAAAACAALLPAAASHEFNYGSDYRYYDRYGRSYETPPLVQPGYVPPVRRGLIYPEPNDRNWYYDRDGRLVYRADRESPQEYYSRREIERAQSGEFDGPSPHPLSKHYSPG